MRVLDQNQEAALVSQAFLNYMFQLISEAEQLYQIHLLQIKKDIQEQENTLRDATNKLEENKRKLRYKLSQIRNLNL